MFVRASICAILLIAAPVRAQTEAELERARATFAEGVERLNRSQWAEAAARFREVMAVRPTAQVKYNLGLALSHLGEEEVRESRRHLREAAEDETAPANIRASARQRLDELGPGEEAPAPGEEAPVETTAVGRGTLQQPFTGTRPFVLEAHAGLSFWGIGFVTGVRFGIPLVHQFVPSINNALYLHVGADFYYVRRLRSLYGPGIGIPVMLHWEIYFDDAWSIFLELGGQFFVHPLVFENGRYDAYEPAFFVIFGAGVTWRVHPNVAFTLRAGTPVASLGVTFLF